jgi:metal-responsive CopG/Arc/MetJ family transcriptional regulator
MPDVMIHVRVAPSLRDTIESVADQYCTSHSEIIRNALEQYCGQWKHFKHGYERGGTYIYPTREE